jgi:hypothetical protein
MSDLHCKKPHYTGWSKSLCAPDYYSTVQLIIWRRPSQNTFGMWTVLYWTRSSRTQFGVSINVWRLVGDTLNITCNFLYCNHQVHRDFLITLYLLHFSQNWSIREGCGSGPRILNNWHMKMTLQGAVHMIYITVHCLYGQYIGTLRNEWYFQETNACRTDSWSYHYLLYLVSVCNQ